MSSGMGEQKLLFSFFAALKMVSDEVFFLVCVRLNRGPILTAASPVQPVFDEKV